MRQPKKRDHIKQRRTRFVKEYLLDQNATRAAIAAGYSEKTARSQGHRLLTKDDIKSQIETENAKVNAKLDVTVERIKKELARLAYCDVRSFFNPDGSAKAITELDEDSARAIAGFEMAELFTGTGEERATAGYIKKFKLTDKVRALEQLGRHLKMFTDRVELSGDEEFLRILDEGRKRAANR